MNDPGTNPDAPRLAELDGLAAALRDGEFSAAQRERLDRLLADDPACRERFLKHMHLAAILHEDAAALLDGHDGRDSHHRRNKVVPFVTIATLAAAAVFMILVAPRLIDPGDKAAQYPTLIPLEGVVEIIDSGGQPVAATGETALPPGTGITTGSDEAAATIRYPDGTLLVMAGPGKLRVGSASHKDLVVEEGVVFSNVAKQPAGKPMVIHTPRAELVVLGTRFAVEAKSDVTDMEVIEGRVRLKRLSDGATTEVSAGQRLTVRDEDRASLLVKDGLPPAQSWREDFESGMGSWTRGEWTRKGLPAASRGGVRLIPANANAHRAGAKDFLRGLFEAHPDTHIRITYKMERPAWVNLFLLTHRVDDNGSLSWQMYLYNEIPFFPLAPVKWREVTIPLSKFKARSAPREYAGYAGPPPAPGEIIKTFWFSTIGEDRGLIIDEVSVSRGGPGELSVVELE